VSDLLVRGGQVVDATGTRGADVLVRNGVIAAVATALEPEGRRTRVLDAGGCIVAPG
jgi:dihydroorotase-like cyclic amidohydrolase